MIMMVSLLPSFLLLLFSVGLQFVYPSVYVICLSTIPSRVLPPSSSSSVSSSIRLPATRRIARASRTGRRRTQKPLYLQNTNNQHTTDADTTNVIRSYSLEESNSHHDEHQPSMSCSELLKSPVATDKDDDDAEEDEVEYLWPTKKRHFSFAIPTRAPASSTNSGSSSSNSGKRNDTCITIRETSFGCGKLGYGVWECGIALCLYLAATITPHEQTQPTTILELGAGCGLPTIFCREILQHHKHAATNSGVVATDVWQEDTESVTEKHRLMPTKYHGMNLHYNVIDQFQNPKMNDDKEDDNFDDAIMKKKTTSSSSSISTTTTTTNVVQLDWRDAENTHTVKNTYQPDLIIGSDLVYDTEEVEPLLTTLAILLGGDGEATNATNAERQSSSPPRPRAILVLPLPPTERKSLPDFQQKLPEYFAKTHTVRFNTIHLYDNTSTTTRTTKNRNVRTNESHSKHGDAECNEEIIPAFLTIDIIPK